MNLVADICKIPARLEERGEVSVVTLLDESGYRSAPTDLNVEAVVAYLERHPPLIDAWIGYSTDKRVSSGWYIVEDSGERFVVGWYPQGERFFFEDRYRACAEFIVREVRSIAG